MLYPQVLADTLYNQQKGDLSPKISTPSIKLVNTSRNINHNENNQYSDDFVSSQSVDADETLKLISDLQIDKRKNNSKLGFVEQETMKKNILKLNPLKKFKSNNATLSLSSSISQSNSRTPSSRKVRKHQLPALDPLKLSRSNSFSKSIDNQSPVNTYLSNRSTSNRSNLVSISSIVSSDYITQTNVSTRSSSISSMEWDTKNLKTKKVLFRCTRHGRYKDVQNILEKGINPNIKDEYGNTILLVAAQNGSKKLVKTALRYNANINHKNYKGNTALHYAFSYGYKLLGEYILNKGADDRIKNQFGLTCYEGINLNSKKSKRTINKTAKEILQIQDSERKKIM